MKTIKVTGIFIFVALLAIPAIGQKSKEDKKAAKKELQAKADAERAAVLHTIIEAKQYVLEANFRTDTYGQRLVVEPSLNFIGIDVDKSAFLFGNWQNRNDGNRTSYREGNVSNYKMSQNKKGMYSIEFNVSTSACTIFVVLTAFPTGSADATINGRLTYSGTLVPLSESRVLYCSQKL